MPSLGRGPLLPHPAPKTAAVGTSLYGLGRRLSHRPRAPVVRPFALISSIVNTCHNLSPSLALYPLTPTRALANKCRRRSTAGKESM